MRLISIFIFLLFGMEAFCQLATTNGLQIHYQLYIDNSLPITYPTILHIKNDLTIYQSKPRLKEEWTGGKVKSDIDFSTYAKTTNIEDGYLKINHRDKEILFFDYLPTVSMLITDNYPEFEWKLTDEVKTIIGVSCRKAMTSYRGRDWVAWFAPEIAIPYGPWKLHGLPGLILEAYDTNEVFTMRATQIENTESPLFREDFEKLVTTHNKKPISYKKFLENRLEAFENMVKEMNSGGRNMVFEQPPRTGYELKYEWEE